MENTGLPWAKKQTGAGLVPCPGYPHTLIVIPDGRIETHRRK